VVVCFVDIGGIVDQTITESEFKLSFHKFQKYKNIFKICG